MEQVPPRSGASSSARHIPELDGIRAIAIWLVLASHLFEVPPADVRGIAMLPSVVRGIVHHGFLGVDLFFVLSGYLITGILLRSKRSSLREYFGGFYKRRALRIFPLYFLVFALIMIAFGPAYLPFVWLGTFFAANLSSIFGIAVPPSATPYWSLAVEEQFYLVWPWLVLWLPKRALAALVSALLVVEPVVRLVLPGELSLTWYHSDGLAIGALVAILLSEWKGERRYIWSIAAVFIGTLAVVTVAGLPFGILKAGPVATGLRLTQADLLFGTLVLCGAGFSGAPALAILRTRVAKTTATFSYCIYLVHRPLIDLYDHFLPLLYPHSASFSPAQADLARAAFVLTFAYAVAALSWRYFESPILRLGQPSQRRPLTAPAAP